VTSTTRYQGGYVECTGTPIQGRSGGGLFTPDGQVAGVCVFANPGSRRGLYTGLKTIHALLDRVGLSSLYRDSVSAPSNRLARAENRPDEPRFEDVSSGEIPLKQQAYAVSEQSTDQLRLSDSTPGRMQSKTKTPVSRESRTPLSDSVLEVLREAQGSEVVCIVRPRGNPSGVSRVVIIHEASPQFVSELTGELRKQLQPASIAVHRQSVVHEIAVPEPEEAAFFGQSPVGPADSVLPGQTLPQVSVRSTDDRDSELHRYRRRR